MRLVGAGLVRCAEADGRLGRDHGRTVGGLGLGKRLFDGLGIVTVDFDGVPAGGLEALELVGRIRVRHIAVDRDAVIVPDQRDLGQLQMPGKRDGFLGNAFHQAAVAGQDVGAVVDDVGAEFGGELLLGHGHADAVGDALAQRPGGRFDAGGVAVFGMASGLGAELAEILQLLHRHVLITEQVERGVKEHGAVAGRQHEPVAVGPVRILRIERHHLREQDGGNICCPHWQAGVAGIGFFNGIHG